MGSGTDVTYQPSNYEEQGGARTVIGGELDVVSGGQIDIESGGSINLASGAALNIASGASLGFAVQSLGTSQVATNVIANGLTTVTASTTAPNYTLDAPVVGETKHLACTANTSSGTCTFSSNSTGVSFTSSGDNLLTMNSLADRVTLIAATTLAWIITSNVGSVSSGTQST